MSEPIYLYAREQRERGLARNTIRQRNMTLFSFQSWLGRPIVTATREDVLRWLDRRLSARSRYSLLSQLHVFFTFAMAEGFADADPTVRIRRPKLPRLVPRPMPTADLRTALVEAPPRVRAMLALGAFEGMRCQEIAGLWREDILEHEEPPLLIVRAGKGGKERVLPLNAYAESALRCHGLPRRGPVFVGKDGVSPMHPRSVQQLLSRFLRTVGVGATPHQLRHAFATMMLREMDGNIRAVQDLLGHASPATTAIYAQWDQTAAAPVVRNLSVMP